MIINRKTFTERPYPKKSVSELLACGMVVINKPKGPFSFEITEAVKDLLDVKKTGHGGTLDPNATGVLPIGVNKGCHVLTVLGKAGKEYKGVMHVHTQVPLSVVIDTSNKFIGKITQLPPVRSAVKRAERERSIYSLVIDNVRDDDVYFTVSCEAGTYIRKLCSEWGDAMGTKAHLKDLKRTRAGPYTLDDAVSMQDFTRNPTKYLLPIETAVSHLKKVWIDDFTIKSMKNGASPFLPGVYKFDSGIEKDEMIALMSPSQELVATATSLLSSEEMKGPRGKVAIIERSFL